MKKIIYVLLAIAAVNGAAIAAEAEYDYPPEFADLFEQFRVITPEEVQIDVALYGDDPWHTYAGGIILEPILLRCFNGLPAYYLTISYNGRSKETRQDMEKIIRLLNNKRGFDAGELADMVSALEPNWGDFYTFGRPAWTNGSGGRMKTPYIPQLLVDFEAYLNNIEAESKTTDGGYCKVYMTYPALTNPVFAFQSPVLEKAYYLAKPSTGEAVITDERELDMIFLQMTRYLLNAYRENPGMFLEEHEYWRDENRLLKDVEKRGEYLKVREYVGTTDGGLDGEKIEDVPDFNRCTAPGDDYSGDCWVWSMVSDLVFHSQCENDYGKGLVWRDYENPQGKNETPKFDSGAYDWNYGTWHFGDEADERLT